jgi:hypothetical protein
MALTALRLFLAQWGAGLLAFLLLVPRGAGTGFFRVCGALAALFLACAAALRPWEGAAAVPGVLAAAGAAAGLPLAGRGAPRFAALLASAGLALAAVALEAGGSALVVAHALASAALLGSVLVAMLFGHRYLILPDFPVAPLCRLAAAFAAAALVKTVLGLAPLFGDGPGRALREDFLRQGGLFFLPRALLGFLAPIALGVMAWQTARIRSTQSATGILYAAVICTLMGELLGKYLYLTCGVPG